MLKRVAAHRYERWARVNSSPNAGSDTVWIIDLDPLLGSMRHNVSQDVYRLLDRWLARLVLFDTIVKQSMDAETRCNAIGLSDGFESIVHTMLKID